MILEVFSNLDDSMTLSTTDTGCQATWVCKAENQHTTSCLVAVLKQGQRKQHLFRKSRKLLIVGTLQRSPKNLPQQQQIFKKLKRTNKTPHKYRASTPLMWVILTATVLRSMPSVLQSMPSLAANTCRTDTYTEKQHRYLFSALCKISTPVSQQGILEINQTVAKECFNTLHEAQIPTAESKI